MNSDQHLRTVTLQGYELTTWDTYRTGAFRESILGYRFAAPRGEVLFTGEDFCCSPLLDIDSDEAVRSLLGFLCLRPGDTDSEYFENYTPAQLAFAEGDAEQLSMYAMEEDPFPFDE